MPLSERLFSSTSCCRLTTRDRFPALAPSPTSTIVSAIKDGTEPRERMQAKFLGHGKIVGAPSFLPQRHYPLRCCRQGRYNPSVVMTGRHRRRPTRTAWRGPFPGDHEPTVRRPLTVATRARGAASSCPGQVAQSPALFGTLRFLDSAVPWHVIAGIGQGARRKEPQSPEKRGTLRYPVYSVVRTSWTGNVCCRTMGSDGYGRTIAR